MTADPSRVAEQPSCANALSQFIKKFRSENIKWIKTKYNTLDNVDNVYIAVDPVFAKPCRKTLAMSGDYYIELHTHTPNAGYEFSLADKMRIKQLNTRNPITKDPKHTAPIMVENCNIVQVNDNGKDSIPFIRRRDLIEAVMRSMVPATNIYFNDIDAFQRWCDHVVREREQQQEQQQQEALRVKRPGGFDDSFTVKESDYGNFLHNDLNSGYDQYSDYVESSILSSGSGLYNVNYDSLLVLSLCGVIGLVLLFCLICFVFALVCGYITGKMHRVRKIGNSEISSYEIAIENDSH